MSLEKGSTLEKLGIKNRLGLRCIARRQYKGEFTDEDCSGALIDFYPAIEEPIGKILEAVARRLQADGDYLEFQIIIRPTFSGKEMREAAVLGEAKK